MRSVARRAGRHGLVLGAVLGGSLLVAGCSSHSTTGSLNTEVAGQLANGELPGSGAGHASTTVPLAAQNTLTALFSSINTFQSCLQGLGVTFIGIPNAADPSSPANNPSYVKDLTTCAAQSNILQALQAAQDAQKNLTLAQIKTENKQYLKWRTCMIGKGWTIPAPTPNAQGLLFSFGGPGGSGAGAGAGADGGTGIGGIVPPPGKTILSSGDMEACASQALG